MRDYGLTPNEHFLAISWRDQCTFFLDESLLLLLSGGTTHTNLLVFGLIRRGLESTIYCTRGEHANHDTTDVVTKTESDGVFI